MPIELSTELLMLGCSVILGIVQLMVATQVSTSMRGLAWILSPRDEKKPDLEGKVGRPERSFKNFMETFPFFLAAVVGAQLLNRHGTLSVVGAELYFACRVVHFAVYLLGIPVIRTLIWLGSLVGILMILAQQLVSIS